MKDLSKFSLVLLVTLISLQAPLGAKAQGPQKPGASAEPTPAPGTAPAVPPTKQQPPVSAPAAAGAPAAPVPAPAAAPAQTSAPVASDLPKDVQNTLDFMTQQKATPEQLEAYKIVLMDAFLKPTQELAERLVNYLKSDLFNIFKYGTDRSAALKKEGQNYDAENLIMDAGVEPVCENLLAPVDGKAPVWTIFNGFAATPEFGQSLLAGLYRQRTTRIRFSIAGACDKPDEPLVIRTVAPILGKTSSGQTAIWGINPLPEERGQISKKNKAFAFHIPYIYATTPPPKPAAPAAPAKPVAKNAKAKAPAKPELAISAPTPDWSLQMMNGPDQDPIPNRAARVFCKVPKVEGRENMASSLICFVYAVYREGEEKDFQYKSLATPPKPEEVRKVILLKLAEMPKKIEEPAKAPAPQQQEPAKPTAPKPVPRSTDPKPETTKPNASTSDANAETPKGTKAPPAKPKGPKVFDEEPTAKNEDEKPAAPQNTKPKSSGSNGKRSVGKPLIRAGRVRGVIHMTVQQQHSLDGEAIFAGGKILPANTKVSGNWCRWTKDGYKISTMAMNQVIVDVRGIATYDFEAMKNENPNSLVLLENPVKVFAITVEDAERKEPVGNLFCEFPGFDLKTQVGIDDLQDIFGPTITLRVEAQP